MGSIPGSGRSPGGGHGSPLQYSCLEHPVDRGAWQATVHRVARVGHDLVTEPPPCAKFPVSSTSLDIPVILIQARYGSLLRTNLSQKALQVGCFLPYPVYCLAGGCVGARVTVIAAFRTLSSMIPATSISCRQSVYSSQIVSFSVKSSGGHSFLDESNFGSRLILRYFSRLKSWLFQCLPG